MSSFHKTPLFNLVMIHKEWSSKDKIIGFPDMTNHIFNTYITDDFIVIVYNWDSAYSIIKKLFNHTLHIILFFYLNHLFFHYIMCFHFHYLQGTF